MPKEAEGHVLSPLEREGALWAKTLEHLVAITPGSNYHHSRNGTFRLTFTLCRPALLEGLARLEKAFGLTHWSNVADGVAAEEPMKQHLPEPIVTLDETPIKAQSELQESTPLDLSYEDIVTATGIMTSQPCAC